MMKAHIVLAHPEQESFNGHLSDITRKSLKSAGFHTTLSDLYRMDFDPREGAHHFESRKNPDVFHAQTEQRHSADIGTLPSVIDAEVQRLLNCDLLVVHVPLWWFGMPAILKGWMDRVFVYGQVYRSTRRYDAGMCAGKKVIACVTAGASADSCAHNGREGDTHMHLWPVLFPFRYLGFEVYQPEIFYGVGGVSFIEGEVDGLSTLETYSGQWATTLESLTSRPLVPYNRDHHFDDTNRLVSDAPAYSPFVRHSPSALHE